MDALGVPPRKGLGVALSACTPRSFVAAGYPLRLLTRNALLGIMFLSLSHAAMAQDTLRFNYRDTKNVLAHLSIDSPTDSVYSPVRGSDFRMFRNDSTVVEIYRDTSQAHLVTRLITRGDSAYSWNYHPNGQLRLYVIEAGENFTDLTYSEAYYSNGQLLAKLDYHPKQAVLATSYWPNGNKQAEYFWYRGTIVGDFSDWYEDGQLKSKGRYFEYPIEQLQNRFCISKQEG